MSGKLRTGLLSPRYDNTQGIREYLGSLADFVDLLRARAEADHLLHAFYVLGGRYCLDVHGRMFIFIGENPPDPSRAADVLTEHQFLKRNGGRMKPDKLLYYAPSHQAPTHLVCPTCGEGWSVHNWHEAIRTYEPAEMSLDSYVGRTLGEVLADLAKRTDAERVPVPGVFLHNAKWVDPSPLHPDAEEMWRREIQKNECGMRGMKEMTPDGVVELGTTMYLRVYHFRHPGCHAQYIAQDTT